MESGKTAADFNFVSYSSYEGAMHPDDAGFDQATNDAIRASNFRITASSSVAVTTPGLKTLPSAYLIGGTGTTIQLTASTPDKDIMGNQRSNTYNFDLGAYQLSGLLSSSPTARTGIHHKITVEGNNILISDVSGLPVTIYTLTGQVVYNNQSNKETLSIHTGKGIYIVNINGLMSKVMVH
jgi:hypothetical protein